MITLNPEHLLIEAVDTIYNSIFLWLRFSKWFNLQSRNRLLIKRTEKTGTELQTNCSDWQTQNAFWHTALNLWHNMSAVMAHLPQTLWGSWEGSCWDFQKIHKRILVYTVTCTPLLPAWTAHWCPTPLGLVLGVYKFKRKTSMIRTITGNSVNIWVTWLLNNTPAKFGIWIYEYSLRKEREIQKCI